MKVIVHFADGADPRVIEAISAPAALRAVNQIGAYVMLPLPFGGYEALRLNVITQLFESATGRTQAQALENLIYVEAH